MKIPDRIYFNEPTSEQQKKLAKRQQTMLCCLFLRHHDGFMRMKYLQKIDPNEYWTTPFLFHLQGDYVIEILVEFHKRLDDKKIKHYSQFISENTAYYQLTLSRMISYWNAYYRTEFPLLKNYVGRIIFDLIETKESRKF